jgi:hypothetical protein
MASALPTRVVLGRDARVVDATADQVCLEGSLRLRPGQRVVIIDGSHARRDTRLAATVTTWAVSALAPQGPTYRGTCRLDAAAGIVYPAHA